MGGRFEIEKLPDGMIELRAVDDDGNVLATVTGRGGDFTIVTQWKLGAELMREGERLANRGRLMMEMAGRLVDA